MDDPLHCEPAPGALCFLLTARRGGRLSRGMTLRVRVIRAPAAGARPKRGGSERHARGRHAKRHHERCDQQRNALSHLLTSFTYPKQNRLTSPPARAEGVAGCATGSARFLSAHLRGGLLSLYFGLSC